MKPHKIHGRRSHVNGKRIYDRTYRAWVAMRLRCNKETSVPYKDYGGRGIQVCPEWEDFMKFLEDMGDCPEGLTLDRVDNSLGYYKENCRWASYTDQNRNKRGVKLSMELANKIRKDERKQTAIASDYGVSRSLIGMIKRGVIWVD